MTLSQQFDESAWQEQIRRRELRRVAASVCELAAKVQLTEDFTTNTPIKLATIIKATAKLLCHHIPSAPVIYLEEINGVLCELAAHLRYVERARIAQTPWSIVEAAENFLMKQAGSESNFIIRPTWSYNYSLVGEFWGFYQKILTCWPWFPLTELKKMVAEVVDANDKIYCISFPRTERENCLLHALWGHEVGHILVARWVESDFESLWINAQNDIKKRIKQQVIKNPPQLNPLFKDLSIDEIVSKRTRAAMEAARRGLTELLCDLIGVHLLGPIAIAAALEFASRFVMDASPLQCGYYPPWRYRIRKMLEYCEDDLQDNDDSDYPTKTIKPFVNWLRQAKNLIKSYNDVTVINSNIETREAYNFIDQNWNTIQGKILSTLPECSSDRYKLHNRAPVIDKLVSRLNAGIPPNETENLSNKPASFPDILSAAWVFKISSITNDANWGSAEDFDLLFRLVLKACECSHVHAMLGPVIMKMDLI